MKTDDNIFCAGMDHHATPLAERERLVALAGDRLTPYLIEHNGAGEVVFLSTCNRVEVYGVSRKRGPEIAEALGHAMPGQLRVAWVTTRGMYLHEGLACWRHLSEVATGLRSMVMGESEILGQVRTAYHNSRELGGTGKAMHNLFQSALRAARAARQSAGFGKGDASVGRCAAEILAENRLLPQAGPLLILGAGHTARSFGLAAKEKGFDHLLISSRTPERAWTLARELGGEVVPWIQWTDAVRVCGVLVSALGGGELPWPTGRWETGPAALVDLGVPRTLNRVRESFPEADWLDLEELAKRSEILPESLGAIHRAEEVLRSHERMWLGADVRSGTTGVAGG